MIPKFKIKSSKQSFDYRHKLLFLFINFILSNLAVFSQQVTKDSINLILNNKISDSSKIVLFEQKAKALMYSDPNSAFQYVAVGLNLAKNSPNKELVTQLKIRLSTILRVQGFFSKALETSLEALSLAEKNEDIESQIKVHTNIGYLFTEQKNFTKAIESYEKGLVLAQKIKHNSLIQILYINMGSNYAQQNMNDSAAKYTTKAYILTSKQKLPNLNVILRNLGNIKYRQKKYTEALAFYRQSVKISNQTEYQNAQVDLELAQIFEGLKNRDSSLYYAKKAYNEAVKSKNFKTIAESSQYLADSYQSYDKSKSYDYLKIATAIKDTLYNQDQIKKLLTIDFQDQLQKQKLTEAQKDYDNRLKTGVLIGFLCLLGILALFQLRNNRQKEKINKQLSKQKKAIEEQKDELNLTLQQLKTTQNQMIQKEKMASLGELTAGIAHEIQNPLNFVNNFSEITKELIEEIPLPPAHADQSWFPDKIPFGGWAAFFEDIKGNLSKINQHGLRASGIVKGMLEHSKLGGGEPHMTNINQLLDEYLSLSQHSLASKGQEYYINIEKNYDKTIPSIYMIPQDIGRVIFNLISNAHYALQAKSKQDNTFMPMLFVKTLQTEHYIEIHIRDNGTGIDSKMKDKIFQPFFTTKPTGQGTGLGLFLSYDIITKGHNGTIVVESVQNEGTVFKITLPKN